VVAGVHLFRKQNEALSSDPHNTPMCTRISTPGRFLTELWNRFSLTGCVSGDGSGFDAHFPEVIVRAIIAFRLKHFPSTKREEVIRYYEQIYLGYKNVFGTYIQLTGNASGHFNTTIDNSLCSVCVFLQYAKMTHSSPFFKVCGDDFIADYLDVPAFHEAARSLGMVYEVLEDSNYLHHSFLGSSPVEVSGVTTYTMDPLKHVADSFWEEPSDEGLRAERLLSYCQITAWSPYVEWFRCEMEYCLHVFTQREQNKFRSLARVEELRKPYLQQEACF